MTKEQKQKYLLDWEKFRQETFEQSKELFGVLNSSNLKQHQDYMKNAQKKWKKDYNGKR